MSRWQKLVEHAEQQTESSSQALAAMRQQIATVEAQREQMQAYRLDYAQRAAQPGTVSSIRHLNVVRTFGDQVQLTVDELDKQLQAMRDRYQSLRDVWNGHYKREQALRALQRLDEKKAALKQERLRRREEDDFSLQVKRRRDAN
ncbi:MAG: flagellar FliJ family protein [Granulosicoccaceae bacterium]